MKLKLYICLFPITSGLGGCIGLGDYMKFPLAPSDQLLWFKRDIVQQQLKADANGCAEAERAKRKAFPPSAGDFEYAAKSRHMVENCMLSKGYTFTNAKPDGSLDYCRKDFYGGGPACKSIGR